MGRTAPPKSLALLLAGAAGLAGISAAGAGAAGPAGIFPAGLRCNAAVDPLGIDDPRPRLSWRLEPTSRSGRDQRQSAYQVLVASSPEVLERDRGDLWDSGRVEGSRSLDVEYRGRPLRTGERVHWKVRAWDGEGHASGFSRPGWWEMALLDAGDWRARWIAQRRPRPLTVSEQFADDPAPLLRREFRLAGEIARARAYVTGLGYYELRLNGSRVGDQVLDPGWTDVRKRVLYSTYDVTRLLRSGSNAAGIMLGNGWYNPLPLPLFGRFDLRKELEVGEPRALLQIEIEYRDGRRETVLSDESWKFAPGPVMRNSVFLGEHYDARRERPGWDRPGFDDAGWAAVDTVAAPTGTLRCQEAPPIRARGVLPAAAVTEPKPGVFIFDHGQNFAGWARVRARGPAGTRVSLRFGELIHADGTLNPMTSVMTQIKNRRANTAIGAPETAWQAGSFTLAGTGKEEVFTPHFTFHGFRYVEVTGYPGRPGLRAVEGIPLAADLPDAGEFACSNEMFNRLQEVVRRTLLSNVFSVQSDCPHREKLGYGGDIVASSEMALFNFDMARFYGKAVTDLADAVRPNGGFTETAPYVGIADAGLGQGAGPVGWGTAHPLLVWQLYQYYGDRRRLEEEYPRVRRWLDLLESRAQDGILDNGIGDHESLVPKPRALTGTGFFYLNLRLAERIARILGRTGDAEAHARRAASVRDAFNRRFYRADSGQYDAGTQASQAFALHLGLAPPEQVQPALRALVTDITDRRGGHLSTGIFGTKYMLRALADLGRCDVAYRVVNQREFPGWGHMLERGATTLWEHWEFSDNVYSHNHPMFGSVSEWFFRALAGINPAEDAEGFDRIVLRPNVTGDLTWVRAGYDSARGPLHSAWRAEGGSFDWRLTLPPNVTAEVHVPARRGTVVREGEVPAEKALACRLLRREECSAVYLVGSGRYRFRSVLP